MKIPFGKPIIGEEERNAVAEVLSGHILVHGPKADEFEDKFAQFCGSPHAISVSSCTAGMHLLYFCLGYGPGDEVIVPAQTHVATAHAVELTGATPVFVDAEPITGNMDVSKMENAVTSATKAIAVVHYLGVPADMAGIMEIAKKHDLFVLEDCALSPGASIEGIHTGLHGDAGVFSFYPVKHITSAEGGMIITKNKNLAEELKLKKAFGVDRTHSQRKMPGVYDTVALGFNYRMSEIHAAIGIEQIIKLPDFLKKRKANHERLTEVLQAINGLSAVPAPSGDVQSSYYCLSILLDQELESQRAAIMELLKNSGVGTSIYYPQPVPRMSYYKNKYGYTEGIYTEAEKFSDRTIALPVGPHLNSEDMNYIGETIEKVFRSIDERN